MFQLLADIIVIGTFNLLKLKDNQINLSDSVLYLILYLYNEKL